MRIRFNGKPIEINEKLLGTTVSRSTGSILRKYSFERKVRGSEISDRFRELLDSYKETDLYEVDDNDSVLRTFLVSNVNYSFSNPIREDTVFTYTVDIMQIERLSTKSLIISGVECEVIRYNEEIDQDSIIINCVFKLSDEERKQINASMEANEYFEVLRPDISMVPVIMRHGKMIWSKHDNYVKLNTVLVEKCYDEKDKRLPFFDQHMILNSIRDLLAENIAHTKLLERILTDNGVLSSADLAKLKDESQTLIREIALEVFCVDDAENYQ